FRRSMVRAVREVSPDLVHCMNVDMLWVGFRASGCRRFVYDSREHFATTGDPPWLTRLWWVTKERILTPRAAGVLTVTDMIAEDLARRYRIPRPTALVNGCTSYVTEALPAHEPLRLLHQGRFYYDRHLDDVIEAVVRLDGRVQFTLQGWGHAEEDLKALVEQRGAGSFVVFQPPCPPDEVVAAAASHDVGIINIWPENDSHRWTGSNKLFDYMGAGIAELVTNLDFTRRIIETEECGIVFDPPTVDALVDRLTYLVENPDEVARMKRNAVKAAAKYSWESQAPALYEAYERALERARRR
ncbi:MAG: glycosyltransferase, partial [Coriobacteriia bacterium]|nr:glycosyltransferase [Coriobacteriia bacterium]